MDVKYQVFVSSTFIDLQDERRSVIEAILNLGHIPVGMEAFQASDDTQWDYIKRRIDESDYYVVIVGERYGSEQNGKSYTQMEYEYAVANGVPVAGFLLDPVARKSWPSNKVEFEKKEKIERFRQLCERKLVKFWKNADELGGRVALALNELMRQKPRTGWVRADSVPSKGVMEELSRLSNEKRELQAQVEKLSRHSHVVVTPPEVLWKIRKLNSITVESTAIIHNDGEHMNLLSMLVDLDDKLASGSDYLDICEFINDVLGYDFGEDDLEILMTEFIKLNLVEASWTHDGRARMRSYSLTDAGKEFLMHAQLWIDENIPAAQPVA